MSCQIPTKPISFRAIMRSPEFKHGFQEVRNGLPFDWRNSNIDWGYERGRLFGFIAPLNMPLFLETGRELNPRAVSLLKAAFFRKLII